jgi:hypothetical protein
MKLFHATEQDLEDILRSFKLDVRIVEMSIGKEFHGTHVL